MEAIRRSRIISKKYSIAYKTGRIRLSKNCIAAHDDVKYKLCKSRIMKTKNQKNNRPKSKNNPNEKQNDLKVGWKEYNMRRQAEGVNRNDNMRRIADVARKKLGIEDSVRDRRVSAILASIVKSENQLIYGYW